MEQDEIQLCGALEALLFGAGYPVSYERLAEVMETDVESVRAAAAKLCDSCAKSGRGIQLIDFGDSCQLCTKEEHINRIRALLSVKRGGNLSRGSFEVLAIIAYHQPVTKSYIEQIRGIDSTYAVNNLTDKQLIEVCGRLDAPGRPALYRTNENFLRLFGLSSIEDLPPIEMFGVPESTGAIASGGDSDEFDTVEVDTVEADKVEADTVEVDTVEADKVEADKVEVDAVEADKVEADKVEADTVEVDTVDIYSPDADDNHDAQ